MTFTNPQQIKNCLLKGAMNAVANAQQEVHDKLDEFLGKYYADYDPHMYERTKQLIHSLVITDTKKTGNGYEGYVYFDYNRLDYITGQQPSGYQVITAAAQGLHGAMGLHTMPGNSKIDIWDMPISELRRDLMPKLKQYLIESGIPVK